MSIETDLVAAAKTRLNNAKAQKKPQSEIAKLEGELATAESNLDKARTRSGQVQPSKQTPWKL